MCFISFHRGKRKMLRACLRLDELVFIPGSLPSRMTAPLVDLFSSFCSPLKFLHVDSFSLPPHSFIPMAVLLFALQRLSYVCVYLCRLLSLPILLYLTLLWSHGSKELRYLWLRYRTDEPRDRLPTLKGYDCRKRPDLGREIQQVVTHVKTRGRVSPCTSSPARPGRLGKCW